MPIYLWILLSPLSGIYIFIIHKREQLHNNYTSRLCVAPNIIFLYSYFSYFWCTGDVQYYTFGQIQSRLCCILYNILTDERTHHILTNRLNLIFLLCHRNKKKSTDGHSSLYGDHLEKYNIQLRYSMRVA